MDKYQKFKFSFGFSCGLVVMDGVVVDFFRFHTPLILQVQYEK